MSWTGVIVLFSVFFFVVLLAILQRGMTTQGEMGEVEPGTPESAPSEIRIWRKFMWAAIGSGLIVGAFALILEFEIFTLDDFEFLFPEPIANPAPLE